MDRLKQFAQNESGAVTVDWVVLTAALVALGIAIGSTMVDGTTGLGKDIWVYMDSLDLFD